MKTRLEAQSVAPNALDLTPNAPQTPLVPPVMLDADFELGSRLPGDHPAWARDRLSLSHRARALVAGLATAAVRTVNAWDHRVRAILIGQRTLCVDGSGSYRLD